MSDTSAFFENISEKADFFYLKLQISNKLTKLKAI